MQKVLAQFEQDADKKDRPLTVVCGYSKGKDIDKMLNMLAASPAVKEVYPVSCNHFRLSPLTDLQAKISAVQSDRKVF